MEYLHIKNWEEWQSYRKDRGTPPWIKVHRSLLSNPKWAALSDSEKGQLISIWIVAADAGGKISANPIVIKKICQLDSAPDTSKFKDLGFLVTTCQPVDNQLTTICQPLDAPETETETYSKEVEIEKKEKKAKAFALPLPDWLPKEGWKDFLEVRKKKNKVPTNKAIQMLIVKLDYLRKKGHDPASVINQSILNSWSGFFEIKGNYNENIIGHGGNFNGSNAASYSDKHQRTLEAAARGHMRAQNPDF